MFSVKTVLLSVSIILNFILFAVQAKAVVDPRAAPNNKYGIHIISATDDEINPAEELVNSSGGDWGYVTLIIESNDRQAQKWQTVFNILREKHLIPIVRLATKPEGNYWKRPYEGEEQAWADFLDNLNWPTKNRYIVIYNEPNQGQEWGGVVDAADYAKTLAKTIEALKAKNPDFFVLNAGFDASAPTIIPKLMDELSFLKQMDEASPGIFNRLDGFVSHSYPNPGFVGLPTAFGRGTVRNWAWEIGVLNSLGMYKDLPIFITETGWKHSDGIYFDKSLPSSEQVGNYFVNAFSFAWDKAQIVAVTPFLLNYQEAPFDHFSFKKLTGKPQDIKILGIQYPEYYPHYQTLAQLPKIAGKPVQINSAKLVSGRIDTPLVYGEKYSFELEFQNTGQSIWGERESVKLRAASGKEELGVEITPLSQGLVKPNDRMKFLVSLFAPKPGNFKLGLQFFADSTQFDSDAINTQIEIKSPVILQMRATLSSAKNPMGEYSLKISPTKFKNSPQVRLNNQGQSYKYEARFLLPEHKYQFTLEKPYYFSKNLDMTVHPGSNLLDFGTLQPNYFSAILHPKKLWQLLPWGN